MALQLCFLLLCHPLLVGCSSKLCSFPHAYLLSTSLNTSLLLYWPPHCTRYRHHRLLVNSSSLSFQSQPVLFQHVFWFLIDLWFGSVSLPCPQASPNQKAREMKCWLQQAYQELLETWASTGGEGYAKRHQVCWMLNHKSSLPYVKHKSYE